MIALAACSSATSESAPAASDEMVATAEASEMMESDSMESEAMESEGHSDDMASSDEMTAEAMTTGAYIDLATYESGKDMYDQGKVVLFFNASWCPTCQEAVGNLEGDPDAIPAGLTIVSVDYDSSDDLKRTYGVTTQHTFVQVDAAGNEVAKWTGSVTAEDIAGKTA